MRTERRVEKKVETSEKEEGLMVFIQREKLNYRI